jgi:hypothetical protein
VCCWLAGQNSDLFNFALSSDAMLAVQTAGTPFIVKMMIFEPFIYKNEHFTKTGSGQTWGKLKKSATVFLQVSDNNTLI